MELKVITAQQKGEFEEKVNEFILAHKIKSMQFQWIGGNFIAYIIYEI